MSKRRCDTDLTALGDTDMALPARIFYRTPFSDGYIGGVCGGIGRYTGIDSTVIRATVVVLTILSGLWPVPVCYALMCLVVPRED